MSFGVVKNLESVPLRKYIKSLIYISHWDPKRKITGLEPAASCVTGGAFKYETAHWELFKQFVMSSHEMSRNAPEVNFK